VPTIIHIHGFGGKDNKPPFAADLAKFFKNNHMENKLVVTTHAWDSMEFSISKMVHNWQTAKNNAQKEVSMLAEKISDLEKRQEPYYLTGFSLGTAVIAHTLNHYKGSLNFLKGIYFMGAALERDFVITQNLPCKIINYYSDGWDFVLKNCFTNSEDKITGGENGFTDLQKFTNLSVNCSHTMLHNYDILADPIGYLISYNENLIIPGTCAFNIKTFTIAGKVLWNNIHETDELIFQHNKLTGHYRAIEKDSMHCRVAYGFNLHAVFKEVRI